MPGPGERPKRRRTTAPLLQVSDFRSYLIEKAAQIAPGDVETALDEGDIARQQAADDRTKHPRLQRQVEVALRLLADHAAGECPQIPYHTVSLLAVAILYLVDPNDVIPDWIPSVGTSDDALVVALAFELGAEGIERYCRFSDLSTEGLWFKAKRRAAGRTAARSVRGRSQR